MAMARNFEVICDKFDADKIRSSLHPDVLKVAACSENLWRRRQGPIHIHTNKNGACCSPLYVVLTIKLKQH
jgi:hypothetical protein